MFFLALLLAFAYVLRRQARLKTAERAERPAVRPEPMSQHEALSALGLREGASRDEVMQAYKRMMVKVHPDHGGSEYLAAKLNEAKEVLLRKPGRHR